MKKFLLIVVLFALLLAGCAQPADVASRNLSIDADNFRIERRIVFYNGITDSYMLTIEGKCALGNADSYGELTVTCKTGPDSYKKHFLGLSDNVTYFVEQIENKGVNNYQYNVIFRPTTIVPAFSVDLSGGE